MELEDLGEQLYNLLAQVLNRPENRAFFDSIRGEYGVLWYLLTKKEAVSAGELKEKLHVVPGRMTGYTHGIGEKGTYHKNRKIKQIREWLMLYSQKRAEKEAARRRKEIHEEYRGLFDILGYDDAKELIRLLKILLTYKK